jgi:hypothetical protein
VKRVYLRPTPGDIAEPDIDTLRAAAVALATFAVNGAMGRDVRDPVHEWVTEGRRLQYEIAHSAGAAWTRKIPPYSSCGDLAHWLLTCLGCRDERFVNRTGDGGKVPWKAALNISRLVSLPAYVSAVRAKGQVPAPGDIVYVAPPDHVAVVTDWDEHEGMVTTCDYGQPYGKRNRKALIRRNTTTFIGTRTLLGWVDISRVDLSETAIVPNDFDGGVPDENPYPEGLHIPPNVP